MIIEKVVLKVGEKTIELTQDEYEELRQHFAARDYVPYVPYPYPVYPDQPYTPAMPWCTTSPAPTPVTTTLTEIIRLND